MTSTHASRPARGTTLVTADGRTLFVSLVQQNRATGEVSVYVRDAARAAERVEYIVSLDQWETFLDEHVAPEVPAATAGFYLRRVVHLAAVIDGTPADHALCGMNLQYGAIDTTADATCPECREVAGRLAAATPIADALATYEAAIAAHGHAIGANFTTPACDCGRRFGTRRGVGLHLAAAHRAASRAYTEATTAAIREDSRAAAQETARLLYAEQSAEPAARRAPSACPACGASTWHPSGRCESHRDERPLQVAHLMNDDLLAACGSTGDALGLYVVPSSTPELITCRRCLLDAVDEEVRRLGYRNAAHYLQGRPELEDRVRVAAIYPEGPVLPRVEVEETLAPVEAPYVTAVLTRRFYDDHVARDLPAGTVIGGSPRTVRVELDRAAYDELLSDARHYADPESGFGSEFAGLIASARTTVSRLLAVGRPGDEPGSEVDDPREQPEPVEWSEDARPAFGSPAWALSLLPENRHA